jgi:hypothetical protein
MALHVARSTPPRRSIRVGLAGAVAASLFMTSAALAAPLRPVAVSAPAPAAFDAAAVDLGLSTVVGGLTRPVAMGGARDGRGRLFVVGR